MKCLVSLNRTLTTLRLETKNRQSEAEPVQEPLENHQRSEKTEVYT